MLHNLENGGLELAWRRTYARGHICKWMITKAWIQSAKITYHLSNSKSVQGLIYRNIQAYRQKNRILAPREGWEGRPSGGKMS